MIVIKHRKCKDVILLRVKDTRLDGWDLSEAFLPGAQMAGLSCVGTVLRGAVLRDSDLRGADLRRADLAGAGLQRADLRGANLAGASLEGADLTDARFDDGTRWPTAALTEPCTVATADDETEIPACRQANRSAAVWTPVTPRARVTCG